MCDRLEQIHEVARRLRQGGVRAGDRVACLGHGDADTVALVLGCWQVGATVVPLSTRYSPPRLQEAIEAMQCRVAVLSARTLDLVSGIRVLPLAHICRLDTAVFGSVRLEQLDLDPEQEASIILTSGSSGQPKGVLHTIGNHLFSAQGADQVIAFDASDTWLMCLPLYHISGFSLIMRALLHGGAIRFGDPGPGLAQGIRQDITHLSLVPLQLQRLLLDDTVRVALQGLRAVLVGGAACPPAWVRSALDLGWPLFLTYGSTEAASQVATAPAGELTACPGATGRVLPYRELRIAPDGEILLRGRTLLKAYVGAHGPEYPFDLAGWFHTGDIGRLDPAGRLHVTGRRDLMFVSGGENIYPEEIERVLLEVDCVAYCAVVSVPDPVYGRRPWAFIKSDAPQAVWDSRIRQRLRVLEGFKCPDRFCVWPSHIPVSLKPDRVALQQCALEMLGP